MIHEVPDLPPLPLPKRGDPINERLMEGIVNRLNAANENKNNSPSSHIRWAITCKDENGDYPDKSDQPLAYPFRFFAVTPEATAPAGSVLPISQLEDRKNWTKNENTSSPDFDGWAINIAEFGNPLAIGSTNEALLDYVPENTEFPAVFSLGNYYMIRPAVDRYIFQAGSDIPVSSLDTSTPQNTRYTAVNCKVFTLGTISATVFAPRPVLDSGSTQIEYPVINPSPSEVIPEDDLFWGVRWAGGVYVATIYPCVA